MWKCRSSECEITIASWLAIRTCAVICWIIWSQPNPHRNMSWVFGRGTVYHASVVTSLKLVNISLNVGRNSTVPPVEWAFPEASTVPGRMLCQIGSGDSVDVHHKSAVSFRSIYRARYRTALSNHCITMSGPSDVETYLRIWYIEVLNLRLCKRGFWFFERTVNFMLFSAMLERNYAKNLNFEYDMTD